MWLKLNIVHDFPKIGIDYFTDKINIRSYFRNATIGRNTTDFITNNNCKSIEATMFVGAIEKESKFETKVN
jgi:hypothetical protein